MRLPQILQWTVRKLVITLLRLAIEGDHTLLSSPPFEQVTRTRFIVNLRAAANLDLATSLTPLGRPDEMIE